MKFWYSMNHYSKRDQEINGKIKTSEYLRCSKDETYRYVVQCRATIELSTKFIIDMYEELKRV